MVNGALSMRNYIAKINGGIETSQIYLFFLLCKMVSTHSHLIDFGLN